MNSWWTDITFANTWAWWLFLVPAAALVWYILLELFSRTEMQLSTAPFLRGLPKPAAWYMRHVFFALRLLGMVVLVMVIARPQSRNEKRKVNSEGIDIMLAIDVSPSMLAKDFKPNRLEVAKEMAARFIEDRFNDRIGTVIFSGEAFTLCPLTIDHEALQTQIGAIDCGELDQGTAIGMGLAKAVERIYESKAKSKIIILLTDGSNNAGALAPLNAGEVAKAFGVRVYTIGVGTKGEALMPVAYGPGGYTYDYVQVDIDEPTLQQIADITGGKYFRAVDKESLENIYAEIDRMEKTVFDSKQHGKRKEEFLPFIIVAMALLLIDFICRNTWLKGIA